MGRKYEVINHFDVWGHSSDACAQWGCPCMVDGEHDDNACECHYEVNESRREGEIELPDDDYVGDLTILRLMIEGGFIREGTLPSQIAVEEPGDFINIDAARDGMPLYSLHPID